MGFSLSSSSLLLCLFTQPFNKDSLSPRSIPGILLVLETKTQVRPVSTLKELPVWKGRQTYILKITKDASKCYGNPNQFLYYVSESELTWVPFQKGSLLLEGSSLNSTILHCLPWFYPYHSSPSSALLFSRFLKHRQFSEVLYSVFFSLYLPFLGTKSIPWCQWLLEIHSSHPDFSLQLQT